MISLDATTKSLEVVLGSAVTTTAMDWNVYYYDVPSRTIQDQAEYRQGHAHGQTNGTTTVTLVNAPPNGVTRNITHISVCNRDTATKQVIIKMDISTTERWLVSPPLLSGETLMYSSNGGWQIL